MLDRHDHLEQRCPRLGSLITFQYCRKHGGEGGLCWKLLDCWWEHFDVRAYVSETYGEDTAEKLAADKPKPKIASLIELIAAARQRTGE